MLNKTVLYDLNKLEVEQSIKIYSKGRDIFGNDKVDIYIINRKKDGLYISYNKKNSFDCEDMNIDFNNKILHIGVKNEKENLQTMNLTENEKTLLLQKSFKKNLIVKNENLEGEYVDGTIFCFSKIIQVEEVKYKSS